MVSTRSRSEMPAAEPVAVAPSTDHRPTVECVAAPRSEPPPESAVDRRVDRLIEENLALMIERKGLREIADARATRANECLKHARDARGLIRAYVEACTEAERLGALPLDAEENLQAGCLSLEVARMKANEAYQALVAFIATPL